MADLMKRQAGTFFLFALLLAGCASSPSPTPPVAPELAASIAAMERAFEADQSNLPLAYIIATLQGQAMNRERTIDYLNLLIRERWELGANLFDFQGMSNDRAIMSLIKQLQQLQPRVAKSQFSFELKDDQLIPEGMAYDWKGNRFVIGSIRQRKIIAVDRAAGSAGDLVKPGEGGLGGVLGVRADPTRNLLWAASFADKSIPSVDPSEFGDSALFAFDLATGLVRKRLPLGGEGTQQLNDLCVMNDGTVYVTDSASGGIYRASPSHEALEVFIEPGKMSYPNGIACDDEKNRLFVAQFGGVAMVDLSSKVSRRLLAPPGVYAGGFDGLYLAGNSLVGIQNAVGSGRVVRVALNETRDAVTALEVLEAGNPDFHLPTTGVVTGGQFYYISNSQLRMFDEAGERTEGVELRRPLVFRLKLPWLGD